MKLKIGNIKLDNPLILAPMVDVTDCVYRKLCRDCGAGLAYTEMLYINAIMHDNKKTKQLMKKYDGEKPVGLQITGNSLSEFENFVESKKWKGFDLVDLNCGCPSMRITGSCAGSFLMNAPKKIGDIIKILKKTRKPITAKIRLGYKKINVIEVSKIIENAGADALTVHPRLAVEGRDVAAKWKWLEKIKKVIKIPLIGNGDVDCGEQAKRMLEICDGAMIARAAIGDPAIFDRILKYLETGKEEKDDLKKRLILYKKYLDGTERYFGEGFDMGRVKYLGGKFMKGFEGAAVRRAQIAKVKSIREMKDLINEIAKMNIL